MCAASLLYTAGGVIFASEAFHLHPWSKTPTFHRMPAALGKPVTTVANENPVCDWYLKYCCPCSFKKPT
jgi:hypothetical protein